MKKSIIAHALVISLLFLIFSNKAFSIHAIPLVNLTSSYNGTTLTVNGSSDSPTCANIDYYMDVQIICPLSGNILMQDSSTMVKPMCDIVPYPTLTFNVSGLCLG
ncbi:MAG: hypothetical protein H0X62_02715, partial [Bacteroidetes bacterium]|nr:hypothetical protein [Bacteroidota bacterium]